jgi:hypothetical protein
MEQCGFQSNVLAKSFFETEISKMDAEIIHLNLSKPALRALIRLNIYSFMDLSQISRESLKNAHGLGPATLNKLNSFLKESS